MIILRLLERLPFFADFSQQEKQMLADSDSYFATFDNGAKIIQEGDDSDHSLFLLMDGKVLVTKDEHPNSTLAILEAGSIFGEMSFLTRQKRSTNVLAHGKVMVFRLDGETFDRFTPELKVKIQQKLIQILVRRLERMNEILNITLGEVFALH